MQAHTQCSALAGKQNLKGKNPISSEALPTAIKERNIPRAKHSVSSHQSNEEEISMRIRRVPSSATFLTNVSRVVNAL